MPEGGAGPRPPLRSLGLALRAGEAVVGTRAVREAAAAGELELLVVAGDAAENARDRVRRALADPAVRTLRLADRASLGTALGRGPVAVAGVTDRGLAEKVVAEAETGGRGAGAAPGRNDERPGGKKE